MKSPILFLPTLLEIALVLAIHEGISTRPTLGPALTPARRAAEMRVLRTELKSAAAHLDALEAQGSEFLSRGMHAVVIMPSNPSGSGPTTRRRLSHRDRALRNQPTPRSITGVPHV